MISELGLGILCAALATLTLALLLLVAGAVLVVRFIRRFRVMHAERIGEDVVVNGRFKE